MSFVAKKLCRIAKTLHKGWAPSQLGAIPSDPTCVTLKFVYAFDVYT